MLDHFIPPRDDPDAFILDLEEKPRNRCLSNATPEELRRLLTTTKVTLVADFLARGRTLDDFEGVIAMYMRQFAEQGDLTSLAKAILKTVDLREHREGSG